MDRRTPLSIDRNDSGSDVGVIYRIVLKIGLWVRLMYVSAPDVIGISFNKIAWNAAARVSAQSTVEHVNNGIARIHRKLHYAHEFHQNIRNEIEE